MADFPKYQYSEFLKGQRDGQIVIRADTVEEFEEAKRYLNTIVAKHNQNAPVVSPVAPQQGEQRAAVSVEQFQEMCQNCNIPKVQSKKGNMYCPNKCWLK